MQRDADAAGQLLVVVAQIVVVVGGAEAGAGLVSEAAVRRRPGEAGGRPRPAPVRADGRRGRSAAAAAAAASAGGGSSVVAGPGAAGPSPAEGRGLDGHGSDGMRVLRYVVLVCVLCVVACMCREVDLLSFGFACFFSTLRVNTHTLNLCRLGLCFGRRLRQLAQEEERTKCSGFACLLGGARSGEIHRYPMLTMMIRYAFVLQKNKSQWSVQCESRLLKQFNSNPSLRERASARP